MTTTIPNYSSMSPLTARFAYHWHVEGMRGGTYRLGDDHGHHVRQHYFTFESAAAAAQQYNAQL